MKKALCLAVALLIMGSAAIAGELGYGMYGGTPSIKYNFNKDFSGQLGLGYATSSAAGAAGALTLLLNGSYQIGAIGANKVVSGGTLNYASNAGNVSGWNTTTLSWVLGVETALNPQVTLGFLLTPISYTSNSFGGATNTVFSILNGGVITAHIYL